MTPGGGGEGRTTLGEGSKVTVGLLFLLCSALVGGVAWVIAQTYTIRDNTGRALDERLQKYVSRDVFDVSMESVRRENAYRFDAIERGLSELKASAAQLRVEVERK